MQSIDPPSPLRNTDSDWEKIAQENPYWGVLSAEIYKGTEINGKVEEGFFRSGQIYVESLFGLVRKVLDAEFSPKRSVDFGCGVGRLLIPIARKSGEAVGVDVSQTMLEICRKNLLAAGVDNSRAVLGDDQLTALDGAFDFVNSYIVIQHIPPERGYRIISRLVSLLAKGGIGSLQLTYAKHRKFLVHETSAAKYYRRDGSLLIDIGERQHVPPLGTVTMFDYDLNQIVAELNRVAGSPVLLLPTADDDHLGAHFVFQRAR